MIQIGLTGVVGAVGWLMRRSVTQIDARMDKHDERIEELEHNSVTKEDWLREAGATRQKLDRIEDGIARLEGKQDQGVEIAAAIAAAFNAQRRSDS